MYHPLPQPDEIPKKDKEDAMGAYLMMFAAVGVGLPIPFLPLIASFIYVFINKGSAFVKYHALHSLYAQIPVSLLNAGLFFWVVGLILGRYEFNDYMKGYIALVVVSTLVYTIFSIIAAVKAHRGQMYYFVFFGKVAYHHAFLIRENEKEKRINTPPKF